MSDNLKARIDAMFRIDRLWAFGFVVGLWLTYAFVFFAVGTINTDGDIKLALIIGGALVLLYNTASITAMVKHYSEDKDHIYTIDIRHLDEMREAKEGR